MLVEVKVMKLVETLGINLIPMNEFMSIHPMIKPDWSAAYDSRTDLIGINTHLSPFQTSISILHEIVHWTGHSKRLNRESIASSETNDYRSVFEYAEEEIIAQLGAYKLFSTMGLPNIEQAYWDTSNYVNGWFRNYEALRKLHAERQTRMSFIDIKRCDYKALEAADWVLKRVLLDNEHKLCA